VLSQRDVYGSNALTPVAVTPSYILYFRQLTSGFSLLLWAGAVLAAIAYAIDSDDPANLVLAVVLVVRPCFWFSCLVAVLLCVVV
jgi:hypothetical protein